MRSRRILRRAAVGAMVLGVLPLPAPAGAQAGSTAMVARFAGTAVVNPSIGLLGVPEAAVPTPGGPWSWSFANDAGACNVAGVSGGQQVAGDCNLSGAGPLLADPDLTAVNEGKPKCGNSVGLSDAASFSDSLRVWRGEVHWDGIARGDPSFSLGSWLLLFGTLSSDAGTAQVVQFLNATGSAQCNPITNSNWPGESRFIVNGVMVVRS